MQWSWGKAFGYQMRMPQKWLLYNRNLNRFVEKNQLPTSCMWMRYLGSGMETMSLKLGLLFETNSAVVPSQTKHVWHPVIPEEIGGSLGAVPWLILSSTASRISSLISFLRKNYELDILCWETPIDRYGMFLRCFLRRKHLFDIVSQKQVSCDFVLPLLAQSEEDLWEVPGGSSYSLPVWADSWPMSLAPTNGESLWLVEKTSPR